MFTIIKMRELEVFVESMSNGFTDEDGDVHEPLEAEQMLERLETIDRLLIVMKTQSLLNKKRGLKKMLNGVIEMSLPNSSVVPGQSNNHLCN
ncbi:MAG: hypothetical protein M9949_04960 [Candidatus Kapabacteria bacterium]|nr:hypothetical protein [Candidatus Kapabacteria bacterium]